MGAPYSEKTRQGIVAYVKAGHSIAQTTRHFGVNRGTVYNYLALDEKGSLKAKPVGGSKAHKFTDKQVEDLYKKNPSLSLIDAGNKLQVSGTAIAKRLKKLGYSYKKKLYAMKNVTTKKGISSSER